ncbi:hypothetical protein R1sor_000324 [Riccia sorocarpa]|uniref:Uncharacterized protein n=1 Tax=Riccia sorocarpa TaxID=122646 RepID=A0ABD3GV59_9MARC
MSNEVEGDEINDDRALIRTSMDEFITTKSPLLADPDDDEESELMDVKMRDELKPVWTLESLVHNAALSETEILLQIGHWRDQEREVSRKIEVLFEEYTELVVQESEMIKKCISLHKQKKGLEASMQKLQAEAACCRAQLGKKERQLKGAHKYLDWTRKVFLRRSEKGDLALQKADAQRQKYFELLGMQKFIIKNFKRKFCLK